MNYKIGKSFNVNLDAAIDEATREFSSPKLILYFSGVNEFEGYTKKLKERFKDCLIIGATTFAGFLKDGAYKDTLVVLGIENGIECYGDVLENADKYPVKYIKRVNECVDKINDYSNTVCFEISSSLVGCEELVLSTLNSVLKDKNIPVFGGSSGDRGRAEKTMIGFNGRVYDKSCVFVLIKNLGGKIHLYRENIYKQTNHIFTATKVDVKNRVVYEYDKRPAALVTAEALNTTVDKLSKYLDSYPLGRIIGKDMFITANQSVEHNNAMSYHARIFNNSRMVLLEPDDYKKVNDNTIEEIKSDVKKPSLSIMVNCLARSMLFEGDGYLNEFPRRMSKALGNFIGFAGYGEQLNEEHFNQTMVVAVFE